MSINSWRNLTEISTLWRKKFSSGSETIVAISHGSHPREGTKGGWCCDPGILCGCGRRQLTKCTVQPAGAGLGFFDRERVIGLLKKHKKTKSKIDGDPFQHLVQKFPDPFAEPVAAIFNAVILSISGCGRGNLSPSYQKIQIPLTCLTAGTSAVLHTSVKSLRTYCYRSSGANLSRTMSSLAWKKAAKQIT